MKTLKLLFLSALIVLSAVPAYSQDTQSEQAKPEEVTPAVVKEESPQPKELSIYGEVQTVNPSAGSLTIQYYDYDSDEEKTIDIISAKDTMIEGVSTINDIKKADWVDVTYESKDGKSMAKSIKVEKEEAAPADTEAPASDTATDTGEDY